jgi:hypothetical protein
MNINDRQPFSARALVAALVCLCTGSAWAQSSPWYIAGSASVSHDSNLLRLGDNQPAGAGASKADTLLSTALVGGLNQHLGRQQLGANLSVRDNRFSRNSRYNNQSYSGSVGLDWSTVNRISGSVSAGAARNLSTFNADGVGLLSEKNLETTKSVNGSVSIGLVTEYSAELSAGHREVRNSLDVESVRARDLNQDDVSAGLAWRPSNAFNVSAALHEVRGVFPTFRAVASGGTASDRFRQQGVDLVASVQPTGASSFDLRLSSANTRYRADSRRDFSGLNGSVGWLWQATGKLRLNSRLARDKGQDNYPSTQLLLVEVFDAQGNPGLVRAILPVTLSDRRTVSTARVQADWDFTSRIAVSSSLQWSRRTVTRDTLVPVNAVEPGSIDGTDTTTIVTLGARWVPQRSTLVGCDLRAEQRRATGLLTANLSGNSISCYAQLTIQ